MGRFTIVGWARAQRGAVEPSIVWDLDYAMGPDFLFYYRCKKWRLIRGLLPKYK